MASTLVLSAAESALAQTPPAPSELVHKAHNRVIRTPIDAVTKTKIMPRAASGLARTYSGTPIDVLTYHYDNNRTGWNPNETDLTQANVASANFGLLQTLQVDGNVFAQPLLVSNYVMPDKSTHDVLIIATGNNTVYAFDAQTYAILWQRNLGPAEPYADLNCDEIRPVSGISGTPVIVRRSARAATVYVVAAIEPNPGAFVTQLFAINLSTGADKIPPVDINPSATLSDGSTLTFNPQFQYNRSGLAINNDSIYIGIGSHCDDVWGSISGWLLRYSTKLVPGTAFHTINTPHGPEDTRIELASIWMSGFAPAINAAGNVFVTTGNGDYTGHGAKDWAESVLSLSPNLKHVTTSFTPSSYAMLTQDDMDISSGGIMLIPPLDDQDAQPLAVALGKSATLYLLNQDSLGGMQTGDSGVLQATQLAQENPNNGPLGGTGLWGGPAFFNGSQGRLVYAQIDSDVLRSYLVNGGVAPSLTPYATGTSVGGNGGSFPIVSSDGSGADVSPGSDIVWLIRRSEPMELEAYPANSLGTPIFTGTIGSWSNPDFENSFLTPMVANGRVYAPGAGTVSIFGLVQ